MVQVRKRLLRSDRFLFIVLQKSSCYTEPEQKSILPRCIWARYPIPIFKSRRLVGLTSAQPTSPTPYGAVNTLVLMLLAGGANDPARKAGRMLPVRLAF